MWGSAEANIEAAGGFAAAEGYYTMQFAGVGSDYPVLNEIREMYKKAGQAGAEGDGVHRLLQPRGARSPRSTSRPSAMRSRPSRTARSPAPTSKAGFEKISNFTLGGLVPPLKITPTDHEGGGLVQIWQVKGGKFVKVTDWFSAYPDVVAKHIKEAAKS